jgi:hypothetical protein
LTNIKNFISTGEDNRSQFDAVRCIASACIQVFKFVSLLGFGCVSTHPFFACRSAFDLVAARLDVYQIAL